MQIRLGTLADMPAIIHHRRAMFEDMGLGSAAHLDRMDVHFEPWLREKLVAGDYIAFFAVDDMDAGAVIAAGVGLWIIEWPPGPIDHTSRRGYVMNVYTEPAYRRRGLAKQLMRELLDYCKANSLHSVSLHASREGRPVYDALHFTPTNEMRIQLSVP